MEQLCANKFITLSEMDNFFRKTCKFLKLPQEDTENLNGNPSPSYPCQDRLHGRGARRAATRGPR